VTRSPAWPRPNPAHGLAAAKPCLRCGRLREAEHAGDRMHQACRRVDVECERAVVQIGGWR
jgi:hypothetical protein